MYVVKFALFFENKRFHVKKRTSPNQRLECKFKQYLLGEKEQKPAQKALVYSLDVKRG